MHRPFLSRILAVALGVAALAFAPDAVASSPVAVVVPSAPIWSSTGIHVEAGQLIKITVSPDDRWSLAYWLGFNDAAGYQPWYDNGDKFLYEGNHGELIGYIGEDPFQGNWGNPYYCSNIFGCSPAGSNQLPGYLHVGEFAITPTGFVTIASGSGTLWLGMNDDAVSLGVGDNAGSLTAYVTVENPTIAANVQIVPATLNLGSSGQWVTAFIKLPDRDPSTIGSSSLLLWPPAGAALGPDPRFQPVVGDPDADGVPEFVVKFDRAALAASLGVPAGSDTNVTLTVTGSVQDGTKFTGTATLRVITR